MNCDNRPEPPSAPAKPMLSIIVPVYNTAPYLRQCVDSIIGQSRRESGLIELILVDDGSTDESPSICDGYSADPRVRVIHKPNGGLSDARNAGIDAARGEYLLFIDSDDFIADGAPEQIAGFLREGEFPDVLFLRAINYYEDGRTSEYISGFSRDMFFGRPGDAVLRLLSNGRQAHVSACVKVVRRALIEESGIRFTKGIVGEDVDYSIALYTAASTFDYFDMPYYFYRQGRAGSIMTQRPDKRFRDLMMIIEKWAERAGCGNADGNKYIPQFLYHQYYILISLYKNLSKAHKSAQTRARMRRYAYLLKYTGNKKARLLYIFIKIFGAGSASRALALFGAE